MLALLIVATLAAPAPDPLPAPAPLPEPKITLKSIGKSLQKAAGTVVKGLLTTIETKNAKTTGIVVMVLLTVATLGAAGPELAAAEVAEEVATEAAARTAADAAASAAEKKAAEEAAQAAARNTAQISAKESTAAVADSSPTAASNISAADKAAADEYAHMGYSDSPKGTTFMENIDGKGTSSMRVPGADASAKSTLIFTSTDGSRIVILPNRVAVKYAATTAA